MGIQEGAFDKIADLIARGAGVKDGMAAMLDHCRCAQAERGVGADREAGF